MIEQVFPLHDHEQLNNLQQAWVGTFFRYQPLGKVLYLTPPLLLRYLVMQAC